ncbi:protein mono-ADP-ribosyltransferase PARP4-like isoform X4 [Dendropsophus ebraccatus]|uniref:protein mono-ADP-ribosyltransferase PARP4-like isoform X4 n=1 Tax=Dendropsophus ebraccatus TaxID=150705 RepID=UPI00383207F0
MVNGLCISSSFQSLHRAVYGPQHIPVKVELKIAVSTVHTDHWDHCLQTGERMGADVFSDCIFFIRVNSLSLKVKKKLRNTITLNGGEISLVLSEKCTHAVVNNSTTLNSTQQKKIEKYGISVVNPDFIWKSVQEERLIDVEDQNVQKFQSFSINLTEELKKPFLDRFVNEEKTVESNMEEDMDFEGNDNDENTLDNSEVAKYSCFQKEEEYAIVELLFLTGQCPLSYRISTVYGLPNTSEKQVTFSLVDTAEKACEKYEHRINDVKNKGFTQIDRIPLQAENLASKALQKVLLGEAINITELSPEVAGLVGSIWMDALGHLDSILSCPVQIISLNDLSKAEGILCLIRKALINKDKEEDICEMMQEFYRFIPHKEKIQNDINMKFLTDKQDLCQVIRDMINVIENRSCIFTPSSTAKYKALRCRIEHIDPNSAEFLQVKQSILDHNHSNGQFNILRVFRVGRLSEITNFKSDLGNVKSLLHASSPCNFVGILSRGLMLPEIIVGEFGGERTDIGNLGSGIYFSDSISTSIKYSHPSSVTGSRLLMVCDVALGNCADVFRRDYTITEPPNGFHSVHGVRRKDRLNSDFSDDEYVVYDVKQIQMRYIVQFSTDGDYVHPLYESLFSSIDETPDHRPIQPEPSDDVLLELPEGQVTKGGLEGSDGQQVPLQRIDVKAQVVDLAAKVVMFQTYKNESSFPIEAKYVFPLDSTAAVCGFEAFINGKHIIGEVKEKQQAHREYRSAISEGHGAYLMDQDAPDVFTVSVGNLPPKATVIIKITYVTELEFRFNHIAFSIPGNVAQWQKDKALKENTQDTVAKVGIESDMAPEGSFSFDMSIEMPRKLQSIICWTHKIKLKKTECKAVVQTEESSSFGDDGLTIYIYVEITYIPRMWVEKHPDEDSEACMLIFQPEFNNHYEEAYMTICLDCSNSMESCFRSAKQLALLALDNIYSSYRNVVLFGSNYKEFFYCPKTYQTNDTSNMEQFIKEAKPNMGSTEFWKVLQSLCLLRPKTGRHKVLLISDGHVQNENLVFQILNKNKNHINLFTCGVGTTANKHMLRCLAQYGSGAFEYFADKSKSKWTDQMEKQKKRLDSAACTAASVKWRQYNQNSEILQAPANIPAIFYEDSLFVYGFVSNCTQATLKALVSGEELENMVSTTELQKTTGTILHTLTARALIKDYEDGILQEKENENEMKKQEMKSLIIQLSKEYSLVTQFTSFVAVEKRSADEDIDTEPNVLEIISAEDVDILPYMGWSSPDDEEPADKPEESDVDEDFCGLALFDDGPPEREKSISQSSEAEREVSPLSGSIFHSVEECASVQYPDNLSDSEDGGPERPESSLQRLSGPPMRLLGKGGYSLQLIEPMLLDSAEQSSQPVDCALEISREAPIRRRSSARERRMFDTAEICNAIEMDGIDSQQWTAASFGYNLKARRKPKAASAAPTMSPLSPLVGGLFGSSADPPPPPPPAAMSAAPLSAWAPPLVSGLIGSPAPPPPAAMSAAPLSTCAPRFGFTAAPPPPPGICGYLAAPILPTLFSRKVPPLPGAPPPSVCALPAAPMSAASLDIQASPEDAQQYDSNREIFHKLKKKKKRFSQHMVKERVRILHRMPIETPSWSSLSSLQSPEGYWQLSPELGTLLHINVQYLTEDYLVKKGIRSLGLRGIDTIHKLIATLLVLQIIRVHNILSEIKFKTLMKLDQSVPKSLEYSSIEKATEWARKSDQQYPGICMRLGLGKDWDQATRHLLGLDPIAATSDLYSVLHCLFVV